MPTDSWSVRGAPTRWSVRLVAAAIVAASAVVGTTVPALAGSASPKQVLTRVEKFLKRAKSVELTAALQAGGAQVGTLEQSAVFPDRGDSLLTMGTNVSENLFIGEDSFGRQALPGGRIEDVPFAPFYGHADTYSAFVRPQDIVTLVDRIEHPEVVSDGADGSLLRANFKDPSKVYNLGPHPYTAAHLDVLVAPNGAPKSVTLVANGPDGQVRATTDAITWNGRVTVPRAPTKADLIDKDGVSQFTDTPLYQPKALPRGWRLDFARVLASEQTLEGCRQVQTAYTDPRGHQQIGVQIFQFPTACAKPLQGGVPLTLGAYQGTILDRSATGLRAQLDVNGTTVQLATSLERPQFEKVFAAPAPLDFDKPPKANLPAASS